MTCASTGTELVLNATEGVLQIIVSDGDETLCAQSWHTADRATEILAPALAQICGALKLSLPAFRRIACVNGPGSFTGIRLTLATAAALRRTGQAKTAGLDLMQALAASAAQQHNLPYGNFVWTLTHARRQLVHCRTFLSYGPQIPPQPLCDTDLCPPEEALRRITQSLQTDSAKQKRVLVCGSGLARNAHIFQSLDGMNLVPPAPGVALLALPRLTVPDILALRLLARHAEYEDRDVEPLYVRPCDAVANLPRLAPRMGMDADQARDALADMLSRTPRSSLQPQEPPC